MSDLANTLITAVTRGESTSDEEYDHQLRSHVADLRKITSTKSGKRIEDAELLRVLHPGQNTLGYIFLLDGLTTDRTNDVYIISLVAFLEQFDAIQARYAGPEWRRVLQIAQELVHATKNTQLLVPIRNAILRMDPQSSTFTTSHLEFVSVCLQAGRPREALPILDKDILQFPYKENVDIDVTLPCARHQSSGSFITKRSEISGDITELHVQEYYMLGSLAYIGVRDYERAKVFLQMVLAVPQLNGAVDLYMLEAYKKLILVGLVSDGHPVSITQLVDQGSMRTLDPLARAYVGLSDAFRNRDLAKFHAEMDVADKLWREDGNLGLVLEAAEALRRYRVLDLQRTYAALPVEQVAIYLSQSAQTTMMLLQTMVQQGHLDATITPTTTASDSQNGGSSSTSSAVVRFNASDASRPDQQSAQLTQEQQIQAQIERIAILSEAVKEADRKFSLTKDYGEWLKRNRKGADAGAAAFEDPMEMDDNFNGGGDDEDIMAT